MQNTNFLIDNFAIANNLVDGADSRSTQQEIDFIVSFLPALQGGHILDLPCGNGRHSKCLADMGFKVTGVDIDPDAIKQAQGNYAHSNINFTNEDASEFGKKGREYYGIISLYSCLGYQESKMLDQALIDMFAASLKPSGLLILGTANQKGIAKNITKRAVFSVGALDIIRTDQYNDANQYLDRRYDVMDITQNTKKTILHRRRLYSREEIETMLQHSGFRVEERFSNFQKDVFVEDQSQHGVYICRRL